MIFLLEKKKTQEAEQPESTAGTVTFIICNGNKPTYTLPASLSGTQHGE